MITRSTRCLIRFPISCIFVQSFLGLPAGVVVRPNDRSLLVAFAQTYPRLLYQISIRNLSVKQKSSRSPRVPRSANNWSERISKPCRTFLRSFNVHLGSAKPIKFLGPLSVDFRNFASLLTTEDETLASMEFQVQAMLRFHRWCRSLCVALRAEGKEEGGTRSHVSLQRHGRAIVKSSVEASPSNHIAGTDSLPKEQPELLNSLTQQLLHWLFVAHGEKLPKYGVVGFCCFLILWSKTKYIPLVEMQEHRAN